MKNSPPPPAVEITSDCFLPNEAASPFTKALIELHRYGKNNLNLCSTEKRGFKTPGDRKPAEIVVDASEGFIPLWEINRTLHYRFNEQSLRYFQSPAKARSAILTLFGEAILAWGEASPIAFCENTDTYDFEIFMNRLNDGDDQNGYVLASAFFPSSGRDQLTLYPKMFEQSRQEQVETLIHEIGHIFGLRHFFAADFESAWPSEIYGQHSKFSIMNYGTNSLLTANDKSDLQKLYKQVWSGELQKINGTPIVKVKPYHDLI